MANRIALKSVQCFFLSFLFFPVCWFWKLQSYSLRWKNLATFKTSQLLCNQKPFDTDSIFGCFSRKCFEFYLFVRQFPFVFLHFSLDTHTHNATFISSTFRVYRPQTTPRQINSQRIKNIHTHTHQVTFQRMFMDKFCLFELFARCFFVRRDVLLSFGVWKFSSLQSILKCPQNATCRIALQLVDHTHTHKTSAQTRE